ncbi:hypothetical protein V9T40_010669 [Parthenolecanium corni]|uniref:Uncharacterized protein n=1 Tax=Parthenolecanium corni TaxID=536013 RepID=A0AAN9XYQ1_9HEMI
MEPKNEIIVVWHKQCDIVHNKNLNELMENQLFDSTEAFGENITRKAMCNHGLVRYFMSIKEALDGCCFNGIRDLVGGLTLNYSEKKKLSNASYSKSIQKKLISHFHLTVEFLEQQEGDMDMRKFINIDKYLPDINRKTIQQILNSCWREKILDSKYEFGKLVFTLPQLKSKIYVDRVNLNSLSRFNGYGSVSFLKIKPKKFVEIITNPVKLLKILKKELASKIDMVNLNRLFIQLNSHTLNAVLVNWQKYETNDQQVYYNLIPKKLSDYSHKFEKLISNGHPYYTFAKSKVGFSSEDILNYSPDFQPKVFLMLAAVHKSIIGIATNIENFKYKNWFAQHFSKEWNNWLAVLNMKGIRHKDYIPLPIHPWQVTHYIKKKFFNLTENEILVPLEVTIEVSPTASPRTLLLSRNLSAPHIKLPLSIQATSAIRSYPSHFVKAAPIISEFMRKILASEFSISEKLNIMREDIGLYMNTTREKEAEHLSVTFRENVVSCCLKGEEIAIVVAALFEKFPAWNNSLFIHILKFSGCTTLKGAKQYFIKYVDLVLGSHLDLYLIHGISLEGHQQNTLAVFEYGQIKRFIAKDLGGMYISASVWESHTLLKDFPLSPCFKYDDFYGRAQFLHAVYQSHLEFENVFVSDSEPRLKCVFDNVKARGFCGVIPTYFLTQYRNVTPQYRVMEPKNEIIVVWHKQCDIVHNKNLNELMENQLFDSTEAFGENITRKAMCNHGLVRYFMSIKEALDGCCFNGIRDLVGGLTLNYSEKKKLSNASYSKSIQKKLISHFHLTVEFLEQQKDDKERSKFININKYLPDINRKTIQQILNCCLREKILDSKYEFGKLVFTLPQLKSKIYVDRVNLNSLSRFNGYGSVLFVQNKPKQYEEIITDPVNLLKILKKELASKIDLVNLNKLFMELHSHTLNAVLANWQKYETKDSLWFNEEQVYNNLIPKKLSDYSHKFERLISNWHPYYPFAKSKVGFSSEDILNYSPDFQPKIFLILAAVHKSIIGTATNIENFKYKNWFAQHFSEEWNNWLAVLNMKGIRHKDYIPLPIHPWQVTHYIKKKFFNLTENEILVPLEVTIEVSPTASPRTLLLSRNLSAPHIKLPLSIQATSAIRSYPSHFVKAVPIISEFMRQILASEPSISEKLNIMREDIGLYLNTTGEHLSVTFRENVVRCCLKGKEIAVVVAALFEKFTASNDNLFIYIMKFAGYKTLKDAKQYFSKYADLVLGSHLDLYLIHGISLAGHQQNTLAVFEYGKIKRFVAKDLGGMYISANVAESHILLRDIPLSRRYKNDDFYGQAQVSHTVYQSHLGELVLLLADHFNCSEKFFWNIVRDKTKERFQVLKNRVDNDRWRNEYNAILKANWPARSLFQNRLHNEQGLYHFIKNPLT